MANEVSHRHSATGSTLYFTIRSVARTMWSTAGTPNFETLTVANWANYKVALSESPASSYFYTGTFPAITGNMVAGWYWADIFLQAGGSAAISDTLVASYFGYWDGTTYKWWGDDEIAVGGTVQTPRDLGAITANAINHLNQIYDTDYTDIYDATNKAFLSKLGNFAMGGSSLDLTVKTVTTTGDVVFGGSLTVGGFFIGTTPIYNVMWKNVASVDMSGSNKVVVVGSI